MTIAFLSLIAQAFSNQSHDTPALHTDHAWTNPWTWKWTWTSDTKLFALLTTKSQTHLLPPHRPISDGVFLGLFVFYLVSLYGLLVSPFPRTARAKQIVAFPILIAMVLQPLFITCPTPLIHMGMTVTAIAVGTRMLDLYYVQPWTGVPSRYSFNDAHGSDEVARSKKDLDSKGKGAGRHKEEFLMWDKERFQLEMWAPIRRFSTKRGNTIPAQMMSWKYLFFLSFVYNAIFDFVIFAMCRYSYEDLQNMDTIPYALSMVAASTFIVAHILWICVTVALIYSLVKGCDINSAEWLMLSNKLPYFAFTPVELWVNWQTLFRYLWVDLGFLPVQRFCDKHLGPHRLGRRLAHMAREVLPVLAVFALSSILHAYTVYAVWREPVWGQLFYFMTQGVAVVVTKAIERSQFGIMIRQAYSKGSRPVRWSLQCLGLLMMALFHTITLPIFMDPYKKSEMWRELKERSILWWIWGRQASAPIGP
ncbi:hypothetical protein B0O80DRAFT_433524 [Mortierella sp. GBAus27b]|nr:hypothetical protein BGX31_006817 [Mortierella sp. GBA43]KAI8363356.1 hypothetical protein B0O80DRAFT_433524 [Mortierella sp. GBAus27b]